jgi:hypothetical protein
MNRRTETRFQVYSRAQLVFLDQPEHVLNVSLTDMSGAGFQLLADEDLRPGQMIVVETDAHLMLAETRNSHRRGDRYAVGAQRLHTYSKLDVPDQAGTLQKVQILINDYQQKSRKESAIPSHVEEPVVEEQEIEVGDDGRADIFEPKPSVVLHSVPRAGRPALPRLKAAPSGFIHASTEEAK